MVSELTISPLEVASLYQTHSGDQHSLEISAWKQPSDYSSFVQDFCIVPCVYMNISTCFFINYLSLSILLYFFSVFLHVMPTSESFVVTLKSLLACFKSRSLHTSYLSFLLHLIEFFLLLKKQEAPSDGGTLWVPGRQEAGALLPILSSAKPGDPEGLWAGDPPSFWPSSAPIVNGTSVRVRVGSYGKVISCFYHL